jgi:hypothetical protein
MDAQSKKDILDQGFDMLDNSLNQLKEASDTVQSILKKLALETSDPRFKEMSPKIDSFMETGEKLMMSMKGRILSMRKAI